MKPNYFCEILCRDKLQAASTKKAYDKYDLADSSIVNLALGSQFSFDDVNFVKDLFFEKRLTAFPAGGGNGHSTKLHSAILKFFSRVMID